MKGDAVTRVEGGGAMAEANAAAAEEAEAQHGSNTSSDTMLNKIGFGTMLDTLGGYGCHIFIRGNLYKLCYNTYINIYLV